MKDFTERYNLLCSKFMQRNENTFHSDWNLIIEVIQKIQEILVAEDAEFCIEFYKKNDNVLMTYVSAQESQSQNVDPKQAVIESIWEFLSQRERDRAESRAAPFGI